MTEVQPYDVDPGEQHGVEHFGRVAGRPECGHDLRPGVHA